MVYVLNIDGTPLMPTERYGKVRRMLNRKEAKIVNRRPFTIQLLYNTTGYTQPIKLGVDASNSMIGISASTSKKEVYASEVELRKDVSILVREKTRLKNQRRRRKNRKARPNVKKGMVVRKMPYYIIEKKKSNDNVRIKPSVRQKVLSHVAVVNRITRILPVKEIVVETNQFDNKILNKPNTSDKTYYGSNQREYVLMRDNHTCQWCKGRNRNQILVTRFIHKVPYVFPELYHSTGNTVTLCKTCSDHLDNLRNKYGETDYYKMEFMNVKAKRKRKVNKYESTIMAIDNIVKQNMHTPYIGTMRMKVYNALNSLYPNVKITKGYITKQLRIERGLKNTPINNARVMIGCPNKFQDIYYYMKIRRNHNRQLQRAIPLKHSGLRPLKSPYFTKGFASYDLVSYNGKEYYITKKRQSGYFGLGLADGKTLINSVKWNKIKLLQRRKSYSVEARPC